MILLAVHRSLYLREMLKKVYRTMFSQVSGRSLWTTTVTHAGSLSVSSPSSVNGRERP
jgi:hypothetical protein